MSITVFDKYFLHLPPYNREKDYNSFWEKSISEIKKVPLKPEFKINSKKSTSRFNVYDTAYSGFLRSQVNGELLVPVKKKKPKIVINIHDYNSPSNYRQNSLDGSLAYLFLKLRGHDNLPEQEDQEIKTPGYMIEHILDIETYYVKAVYLDVYRSVDALRLNPELDCSRIGLIAKGFGSAAALFTAAFSKRVSALVLDTPSFCYLPMGQNISTSSAAIEINNFISSRRGKKKQIKKNLTYFDTLNLTDRIKCPVLAIVGLKDTISPPECVFALFNHLQIEKFIEVYPEEGNSAGGKNQFAKSIKWMKSRLSDQAHSPGI